MRLPNAAYTGRPWRIHDIAGGFELEDVWAIRTPGAGREDFPAVLAAMRDFGGAPLPLRFLFAVRWKLGVLFGWDRASAGIGLRVPSLCDRLPADLRRSPRSAGAGLAPFSPVYTLDDECALELANHTVHAVMHLAWAPASGGGHELRMAVLVRPNGLLGRFYMAAITPFRRLFVLPAFTRHLERAWRDRGAGVVHSAVGTGDIPPSARAATSLPVIDYADHFSLATDVEATAEQWARAMFGDVPSAAERFIWRGLLGLRLARGRSPATVAGWRITARGGDWIRLEAASWFLTGNLVVRAAEGRVSLTTLLRHDRRVGHVAWPPLSAIHRRLVPGVLRGAVARMARDGVR
ncbi:DUF2867 domain-containing protein [Nonomuraea sp. WAC 01424]|uniref:DUF2867 domain-containing protein n=1 Tax=Nonomuraea sp. WAC 01424 TaxID=2203200 RepID=UPI000F7AF04D|nr:DUF2867 domain-containing protein [Nonomuraea sp. WAC 01424]RSM98243.1 DUF2867 domain-containing protein [Nonomuraea sp. WAC 01424]